MRKKLIGVLDDLPVDDEWYGNEEIADHLLANDVVKVVRCKDCKHLYCHSAVDRMFYCRHPKGLKGMPNIVEENPFCPYGERREGE